MLFQNTILGGSISQPSNLSPTAEPTINRFPPVLSGEIRTSGEVDTFSISAAPGDIISISLTSDTELWPMIELVNSSGNILSKHNGYGSDFHDLKLFQASNSGDQLFLKVKSQLDSLTGQYTITSTINTPSEIEQEVIRLTNIERAKYNLAPLTYDPILAAAAQLHVEDMDKSGKYLAHTGSNGSSPGNRIQASGYLASWHINDDGSMTYPSQENAAAGQISPQEVVDEWMNSPGHRAAILTPHTEEIGVGFEIDDESSKTYWIQNFGIPWADGDVSFDF